MIEYALRTMEMDSGAGAEREFKRYAPKEGAKYYRAEPMRGSNERVHERAQERAERELSDKRPLKDLRCLCPMCMCEI